MLITGAAAQDRLTNLKVLVVGAGALGCPCLMYLVGAGVGHITIVDGDSIEVSNLHRQPLHSEAGKGMNKAESAAARLRELNSAVTLVAHPRHVMFDDWTTTQVEAHDCVVDCSDNVGTRYLLNDACGLASKTLFSASALGKEGSVSTYAPGDACYRCLNPKPSTFEGRRRCADRGVLGPVPGALGALQALEVITGGNSTDVRVFDGRTLRSFGKPPKRASCELCSGHIKSLLDTKKICEDWGVVVDSKAFGSLKPPPPLELPPEATASCRDLKRARDQGDAVLIDVRDPNQFSMCSLPGAFSFPLKNLLAGGDAALQGLVDAIPPRGRVFVLCRRGIDSRVATRTLRNFEPFATAFPDCRHVDGGLLAWSATIDPTFPTYE